MVPTCIYVCIALTTGNFNIRKKKKNEFHKTFFLYESTCITFNQKLNCISTGIWNTFH